MLNNKVGMYHQGWWCMPIFCPIFFLCEELMPGYLNGITGEYAPPAGYLVNEKEAEAFDREFPYREKKKLPGQIFEGDIR